MTLAFLRIFFKESVLFKLWFVEDGQVTGQVTGQVAHRPSDRISHNIRADIGSSCRDGRATNGKEITQLPPFSSELHTSDHMIHKVG